ncbi:MAG: PAS domain S-box protein, partial [Nitrospiraceae bacterium]|nr:PAS domain S-box protein [Nitrospiraceae bacterium]
MIRVAIVGAGKAGAKLLDIFKANGVVKTVGITDKDPNAPALELARQWGIFIADDIVSLCGQQPDIILNVTGDPQVSSRIREAAPPGADVIEGNGAWFLWEMVQRQRNVQTDMRTLYENGLTLTSAKSLQEVLEATLEKAMELTESPAGSIALYERNEMVMAVSRGMRAEVAELNRWKLRPDGLTAHILSRKEPVEIRDIHEHPLFDSRTLQTEGIRSVLAYPLMVNGGMVGILFLDDFAPRIFSDRHKNLISLFGTQAAQAIEKFRILNELYSVITDLDETTAYLKNVLDDSQDMIMTTTIDGAIVEFSRGGERILGYTREEIVGKRAADFYADRDERAAILDTIRRKGAICNHETTLIRKDGAPVDISLTISQLRNKTGKVIGTVGISKDITEEKRLRNELRDRNEELKELTL